MVNMRRALRIPIIVLLASGALATGAYAIHSIRVSGTAGLTSAAPEADTAIANTGSENSNALVTTTSEASSENSSVDDPLPNEKHVNLDQGKIDLIKSEFSKTVSDSNEPEWQHKADLIITTGMKYLGTPYVFGAKAGQTSTFDCSSFMKYIFGTQGIKLPRDSREQSVVGTQVSLDHLRKGDLVFFTTPPRKLLTGTAHIGHVGVYMGNGLILHTFRPGIGVTISELKGPLLKRFVEARRVIS